MSNDDKRDLATIALVLSIGIIFWALVDQVGIESKVISNKEFIRGNSIYKCETLKTLEVSNGK